MLTATGVKILRGGQPEGKQLLIPVITGNSHCGYG